MASFPSIKAHCILLTFSLAREPSPTGFIRSSFTFIWGWRGSGTHTKATNSLFCVVIICFYLDLPVARKVRRKLNENQPPLSLHIMMALSSYLNSRYTSESFFFYGLCNIRKRNNTREIYRIENSLGYIFLYFLSLAKKKKNKNLFKNMYLELVILQYDNMIW